MPSSLPDWAQTTRGIVMHKLGLWAEKHSSSPTIALARRFTAADLSARGIPLDSVDAIAKAAITDWRATQRAKAADESSDLGSLYGRSGPGNDVIGVRVIVNLEYPNGRPPGSRNTMPVLVNVYVGESIEAVINSVVEAVSEGLVETPHGSPGEGVAVSGSIAQVVAGGFPQAQVEVR